MLNLLTGSGFRILSTWARVEGLDSQSVTACVLRRISRLDLVGLECHFGLSAIALLELSGTDDLYPGHIGDRNRLLRLHRNGDRTSVGRTANDQHANYLKLIRLGAWQILPDNLDRFSGEFLSQALLIFAVQEIGYLDRNITVCRSRQVLIGSIVRISSGLRRLPTFRGSGMRR